MTGCINRGLAVDGAPYPGTLMISTLKANSSIQTVTLKYWEKSYFEPQAKTREYLPKLNSLNPSI